MGRFELHTVDTAPEGSKGTLQAVEDKYGFAPNLMKEFAGAPEQAVEAVRNGDPLEDDRLDALRRFTQEVTARRGRVARMPCFPLQCDPHSRYLTATVSCGISALSTRSSFFSVARR